MLFFGGDEVSAADSHPDVVRLQRPSAQAAACHSRYSDSNSNAAAANAVQVVVAVPSRFEAGWACFDHFFASLGLTRSGEPAPPGYSPAGLPALSQAASLLRDGGWPSFSFSGKGGERGDGSTLDVKELKRMRAGLEEAPPPPSSSSSSLHSWPPTKVVAFSKGGVVANQVLFELSALGHGGFRRRRRRRRRGGAAAAAASAGAGAGAEAEAGNGGGGANAAAVEKLLLLAAAPEGNSNNGDPGLPLPHARNPPPQQRHPAPLLVAALAESIDEIVFLDAGLNCRGAYGVTDPEIARGLALLDSVSSESEGEGEESGGEKEKEKWPFRVELVGTPRQWGDRSRAWLFEEKERMFQCLEGAGVCVSSALVLEGRKPDLRTHFLGIEAFGRGGGGGGGERG